MDIPIIDVSKQTVSEFSSEFSKRKAVRLVAWYRFARPAMVLMIWVLAASYVRWCIANADDSELTLDAFMPGIVGMTTIAVVMVVWTLLRALVAGHAGQVPSREARAGHVVFPAAASRAPEAGRCLMAYHDDDGNIARVEAVAGAVQ
ncbi:conserved protein of unknown function [Burkholderia multivorans]